MEVMEAPGEWLEKALLDLCKKVETGLDLDKDIISGLVSYCQLAEPVDAKEYLDVRALRIALLLFSLPFICFAYLYTGASINFVFMVISGSHYCNFESSSVM